MIIETIKKIKIIAHQSWILLWHKLFIINWGRKSLASLISMLILDIAAPVLLVFIYLYNLI
jgi:hypothetical protein